MSKPVEILLIINQPAYGCEVPYNAMRLAAALCSMDQVEVHIFLLGDGVGCALADQTTPKGYYNLGRQIRSILARGGDVLACGTCSYARGIKDSDLIEGTDIGTMDQLARWVTEADKILTF